MGLKNRGKSQDQPQPQATPKKQSPNTSVNKNDSFSPASPVSAYRAQMNRRSKTGDDEVVNRPSPYIVETDFIDTLYKPHTITLGIVLLSAMFFARQWFVNTGGEVDNVKLGLLACSWTFIVFGSIHLPDGIMIRPHPMVWRGVLSAAVIYLIFMVFLVFQDLATVHKIFAFLDPTLAQMPPQNDYATDCRITTPEEPMKFWNTVCDEFIIAHALGYWAKTLVIRDWRIVTGVSIGFELLEVSFQHILPNFAECWWDHVLIDVLICNAGGTLLGILTLRWLEAKEFNWTKVADIKGIKGKAKRVLRQLGPRSFEHYDWHFFNSFKRFTQSLILLLVFFTQEVNCFTLKHMLHMKPSHPLVVGRLAMWGVFAVPGLREFYDFISDPKCKRIGSMAWVGSAALVFETVLVLKLKQEGNYFTEPMPSYIGIPWIIAFALFALWVVLYFGTKMKYHFLFKYVLHLIVVVMVADLLFMCAMGNKDTMFYQKEFEAFVAEHNLW